METILTDPEPGTPWEDRGRRGLGAFPALIETTRQVLTQPAAFFRRMSKRGGLTAPLLYGVAVGYVSLALAVAVAFLLRMFVVSFAAAFLRRREAFLGPLFAFLESGAALAFGLVVGPVLVVVVLFLEAALTHLGLLLLGKANHPFETTFRVKAYSKAPWIFLPLPVCGNLVGGIWSLVVSIVGVAEAQGISGLAAVGAVLLPRLLLCCCLAGAVLLLFGAGLAALAGLAGVAGAR